MTAKRGFDVIVGTAALLVLAPVMLAICLLIWATMGWPALFRQRRAGLHGRPFEVLKFRTMREAFDAEGNPLPDALRITRLGRVLRASSLDELPELWNVLKGEMSLVGPRPLLVDYLALYAPEQRRRHAVRPGITGLAQVRGRNALTWEEKFRYDLYYVDNRSLLLDFQILSETLLVLLTGYGVNHSSDRPMPRFTGSGSPEEPRT